MKTSSLQTSEAVNPHVFMKKAKFVHSIPAAREKKQDRSGGTLCGSSSKRKRKMKASGSHQQFSQNSQQLPSSGRGQARSMRTLQKTQFGLNHDLITAGCGNPSSSIGTTRDHALKIKRF